MAGFPDCASWYTALSLAGGVAILCGISSCERVHAGRQAVERVLSRSVNQIVVEGLVAVEPAESKANRTSWGGAIGGRNRDDRYGRLVTLRYRRWCRDRDRSGNWATSASIARYNHQSLDCTLTCCIVALCRVGSLKLI